MGWFFGFKRYPPIHRQGQTVAFKITGGNTDDRQPLECITAALRGKGFSDRGSIAESPMKRRWQRGLHLLTGIGRTMKNHLLPLLGKLLSRKRSSIETLFAKLKSGMGLEHSRHHSPRHALVHILSCLAAVLPGPNQGHISTVHIPGLASPYPQLRLHSSSHGEPCQLDLHHHQLGRDADGDGHRRRQQHGPARQPQRDHHPHRHLRRYQLQRDQHRRGPNYGGASSPQ